MKQRPTLNDLRIDEVHLTDLLVRLADVRNSCQV